MKFIYPLTVPFPFQLLLYEIVSFPIYHENKPTATGKNKKQHINIKILYHITSIESIAKDTSFNIVLISTISFGAKDKLSITAIPTIP